MYFELLEHCGRVEGRMERWAMRGRAFEVCNELLGLRARLRVLMQTGRKELGRIGA